MISSDTAQTERRRINDSRTTPRNSIMRGKGLGVVVFLAVLGVMRINMRVETGNSSRANSDTKPYSEKEEPTYLTGSPYRWAVDTHIVIKPKSPPLNSNASSMKSQKKVISGSAAHTNTTDSRESVLYKNTSPLTITSAAVKPKPPSMDFNSDNSGLNWNDSILQRIGWDVDPVVVESHKLLFFTVPKNGCTEWKMLFRRMLNHSDWWSAVPHDPQLNGLRYLGHYSRPRQREMMTSPNWTRAIFVRDPLERVLSAYLDKGIGPERYVKEQCCRIKARQNREERREERRMVRQTQHRTCMRLLPFEAMPTEKILPFERFVKDFMHQCEDPHWQPQHKRLAQPQNWKFINFVGHFERLQRDSRQLLDRIGAYDEFGSNGWGPFQNQSFLERNFASHATSSRAHVERMYTPELKRLVLEFVQGDYEHEILNFTKPAGYYEFL
jgi:hypothetical protein